MDQKNANINASIDDPNANHGSILAKPKINDDSGAAPSPPTNNLLPNITLPKGGGAIKGIGEKFTTNPANGTGSLSVPIATSPGRSGFNVELQLSYDSGSGNSPFGIGWSLSAPSIARKTDKGLPLYQDDLDSDTFILSGAEDLVLLDTQVTNPEYNIKRYRPRTEGLFARIERWTRKADGDVHWRVTTKDNVLNIYGKSPRARIADPEFSLEGKNARIFSWLLEETRDDRGNMARYKYKAEDGKGVLPSGSEFARFKVDEQGSLLRDEVGNAIFSATAQRYLERIQYGNRAPLERNEEAPELSENWLFEIVFDYGNFSNIDTNQYADTAIKPERTLDQEAEDPLAIREAQNWPVRKDPFSNFKPGFEVRTYRLCHRVLMFHRFQESPEGLPISPCLVKSTDFTYEQNNTLTYLEAVTQAGYLWDSEAQHYQRETMPSLELGYQKVTEFKNQVGEIKLEDDKVFASGVDGSSSRWVDLDGEGLPGILRAQSNHWEYHSNQGSAQFSAGKKQSPLPSPSSLNGGAQLSDIQGNGNLAYVQYTSPVQGFFERTHDGEWNNLQNFKQLPNIDFGDPNLRFIDLDGDGYADILITQQDEFVWYRSLAKDGFEESLSVRKKHIEELGPSIVFADGTETIQTVDMSGDGLVDIVRVRNGEVCYWPNLGYGRFGRKITFSNSPWFAAHREFQPNRIRFADIDGAGNTDILYLSNAGIDVYLNQSGNSLKKATEFTSLPVVCPGRSLNVVDIFGTGMSCLVWSSSLAPDGSKPLRYINPLNNKKPHVLVSVQNNLGSETRIEYQSSTHFYLKDRELRRPWLTKLNFPVQVISRIENYDHINKSLFVSRFAYHHGYFDGHEREFRGFACVEQWDAESFSGDNGTGLFTGDEDLNLENDVENQNSSFDLPPTRTVTWFHTGAWLERGRLEKALAKEYYSGDTEAPRLPDTILPTGLSVKEQREATRALKGKTLRVEIYADDDSDRAQHPYTVSEQNYTLKRLTPAVEKRHGVFFSHARETINLHYERNPNDPRMQQELVLVVDEYGNINRSVSLGYPRRKLMLNAAKAQLEETFQKPVNLTDQTKLLAVVTDSAFINRGDAPNQYQISNPNWTSSRSINDSALNEQDWFRLGLPLETTLWELTGLMAPEAPEQATGDTQRWRALTMDDISRAISSAKTNGLLGYDQVADHSASQLRLVEAQCTQYFANDLQASLPLGQVGALGIPYQSYRLAFNAGLIENTLNHSDGNYSRTVDLDWLRNQGRYTQANAIVSSSAYERLIPENLNQNTWWMGAGRVVYSSSARAKQFFYQPERARDPFGNESQVAYDPFVLLPIATTDPVGNTSRTENNYRLLASCHLTDLNDNRTATEFNALGMVTKVAVMGKEANEGDTLENPTIELFYHLHNWRIERKPAFVKTSAREQHKIAESPRQLSYVYSDGNGQEVMTKVQAEAGNAPFRVDGNLVYEMNSNGNPLVNHRGKKILKQRKVDERWVGNGRTVFDNKGNPVKQYEPFFSSTSDFEDEKDLTEWGVTPLMYYDPTGRLILTKQPNGSFSKVEFDAWQQVTWDENDTVLESEWFQRFTNVDPAGPEPKPSPTESDEEIAGRRAVWLAAQHANTPSYSLLDSLGRATLSVAHNRVKREGGVKNEFYYTHMDLDIEGNQRQVIDARNVVVQKQIYDIAGRVIHSQSPDAGNRWMLMDVADKPIYTWDSRRQQQRTLYDKLQRPTHLFIEQGNNSEVLAQRLYYGDEEGAPQEAQNLRGQLYKSFDGAGLLILESNDFKNNPKRTTRRLTKGEAPVADWSELKDTAVSQLEELESSLLINEPFTTRLEYDALNRVTQETLPDGSTSQPKYNRANLLEKVWVSTKGSAPTLYIKNINYNARGQREKIEYGNQSKTEYKYDPDTFRLTRLYTTRLNQFPNECGDDGLLKSEVQDLEYYYDPVGNITEIRDKAQQPIFFCNQVADPVCRYQYDATYQLIKSTGREHPGQQPNHSDQRRGENVPQPANGKALIGYEEFYDYDEVGNILHVNHVAQGQTAGQPIGANWHRYYAYESQGDTPISNRLLCTSMPGDTVPTEGQHQASEGHLPYTARYGHDTHGNFTSMPHIDNMVWSYADHLSRCDFKNGNHATYHYDASGQRVRKIVKKGNLKEERVYLGNYEIYREYGTDETLGKKFERTTQHIMDDQKRVAMVEAVTFENQSELEEPKSRTRYQLDNHLGSCAIELSDTAELISYEEYFAFGGTSYSATRSGAEVSAKQYRYNGKERDEESGLYYYGARYYAGWLGRWASADPAGLKDGINMFVYVGNNPILHIDPTGLGKLKVAVEPAKAVIEHLAKTGSKVGRKSMINFKKFRGKSVDTKMLREATKVSEETLRRIDEKFPGLKVPYTKEGAVRFGEATSEGGNQIVKDLVKIGEFSKDSKKDISRAWKEYAHSTGKSKEEIAELQREYTMHHTYEDGVFQLVDTDVHNAYRHTGGDALKKIGVLSVIGSIFFPNTSKAKGVEQTTKAIVTDTIAFFNPYEDVRDAAEILEAGAEAVADKALNVTDDRGVTVWQAMRYYATGRNRYR